MVKMAEVFSCTFPISAQDVAKAQTHMQETEQQCCLSFGACKQVFGCQFSKPRNLTFPTEACSIDG